MDLSFLLSSHILAIAPDLHTSNPTTLSYKKVTKKGLQILKVALYPPIAPETSFQFTSGMPSLRCPSNLYSKQPFP